MVTRLRSFQKYASVGKNEYRRVQKIHVNNNMISFIKYFAKSKPAIRKFLPARKNCKIFIRCLNFSTLAKYSAEAL